MNRLRQEDSSIYLYLKDIILSDFIEKQEYVPLTLIPTMTVGNTKVYEIEDYFDPSPKSRGRGFTYFDSLTNVCLRNTATVSGTPEQSNRITVYSPTGIVIDENDYVVDYADCRIVTDQAVEPAYIDYHWHYISLLDEWAAVKTTPPPAVVLDVSDTIKEGFQLGHGKKTTRSVTLHVFGSDPAERNDIRETLHDGLYLKSCPLYEFVNGVVLDHDGTFHGRKYNMDKATNLFDRTTVSGVGNIMFENVESRSIKLPYTLARGVADTLLSPINAYRATVTFDAVTYQE